MKTKSNETGNKTITIKPKLSERNGGELWRNKQSC
jgi:hypothetical protein